MRVNDNPINNDEFNCKVRFTYKTKKDRELDSLFETHTSPLDTWRYMTTLTGIEKLKKGIIRLYCPSRKYL